MRIYYRLYNPDVPLKNFKLEKIRLIWVCKSTKEFTWLLKLLNEVEKHVRL